MDLPVRQMVLEGQGRQANRTRAVPSGSCGPVLPKLYVGLTLKSLWFFISHSHLELQEFNKFSWVQRCDSLTCDVNVNVQSSTTRWQRTRRVCRARRRRRTRSSPSTAAIAARRRRRWWPTRPNADATSRAAPPTSSCSKYAPADSTRLPFE